MVGLGLAGVLLTRPALAQSTIFVPGPGAEDPKSIGQALLIATAGDEIVFDPTADGYVSEDQALVIDFDLTVSSTTGSTGALLPGFIIEGGSTVTLNGVTLDPTVDDAQIGGWGLEVVGATASLVDVVFTGSGSGIWLEDATLSGDGVVLLELGGAHGVYVERSDATFNDLEALSNHTWSSLLYVDDGSLTVETGLFDGNGAGEGGGSYFNDADVVLRDVIWRYNRTYFGPYAFYAEYSDVLVEGGELYENYTEMSAWAWFEHGNLTVRGLHGRGRTYADGDVISDTPPLLDGLPLEYLLWAGESTVQFEGVDLSGFLNALWLDATHATVVDSVISGCGIAVGSGRYDYATPDASLTVTGSTFEGNGYTASPNGEGLWGIYGAAIYAEGALTVADSTFRGNVGDLGGAIYAAQTSTSGAPQQLVVTNSLFEDNAASFGGAIYYESWEDIRGEVRASDSVFRANEAYWDSERQPMEMVDGGMAIGSGGAIAVGWGADGSFERLSFEANEAITGGDVAIFEGDLKLRDSTSVDALAHYTGAFVAAHSREYGTFAGATIRLDGVEVHGASAAMAALGALGEGFALEVHGSSFVDYEALGHAGFSVGSGGASLTCNDFCGGTAAIGTTAIVVIDPIYGMWRGAPVDTHTLLHLIPKEGFDAGYLYKVMLGHHYWVSWGDGTPTQVTFRNNTVSNQVVGTDYYWVDGAFQTMLPNGTTAVAHNTFVDAFGDLGVLSLVSRALDVSHNILQGQTSAYTENGWEGGAAAYLEAETGTSDYNLWWNNEATLQDFSTVALGDHEVTEEPVYWSHTTGTCGGTLYLVTDTAPVGGGERSPGVDQGDPEILDLDRTRADIGAFGGPGACIPDADGDGLPENVDCDDSDRHTYPDATEIPYDGKDQNCDGEDLCDLDGDGFISTVCVDEDGNPGTDCNDADPNINPNAIEIPMNGIDENCSGHDECDVDGDGFLSPSCVDEDGNPGTDCNDADPSIHPGATEIPYNGIDEDCDGEDLCDVDGDGFLSPRCADEDGNPGTDCDDTDPDIHPGATEIPYNGIDEDCDGEDLCDVDGDGFLSPLCEDEDGNPGTDCDDADPNTHPEAEDIPGDGIDQDCSGADAEPAVRWIQGGSCSTTGGAPTGAFLSALLLLSMRRRRATEVTR